MEFVEGQFGIRMRYEVIDPNFADKGYKKFEADKKLSTDIDSFLRQNITLLRITRKGTGTETEYTV
jgi:hypothetical protein